jgi:small-conductance mechanosensitive channel
MQLPQLADHLKDLLNGEPGRLFSTLLLVLAAVYANRVLARVLTNPFDQASSSRDRNKQRERLVLLRNLVFMVAAFAILAIWATKIAGLAVSLAAVAGAMLIVGKDFFMCLLGSVVIAFARQYRVGDYIEVGNCSGKVINIDLFTTTLAETGHAHQITGKALTFANSSVFTQPVRNTSATGEYIVNLFVIPVPFDVDFVHAEICAFNAAQEVSKEWQAAADIHLSRMERRDFVDLPSAKPKILWESVDTRQKNLVVRFTCPMDMRISSEQAIYRAFWGSYGTVAPLSAKEQALFDDAPL